jgi:hypothetical protein
LAHNPDSPAVRAHVARQLESTARCDPGFARELAFLVAQLDRSGGRRLINNVRAQINVQAFDGGYAHYGDYNEGDIYTNDYDPADELVAGQGIGRFRRDHRLTVTLAGFLGFVWVLYDAFRNGGPRLVPAGPRDPPGVPMLPVGFLAFPVRRDCLTAWAPLRPKPPAKRQQQADAPQADAIGPMSSVALRGIIIGGNTTGAPMAITICE